MPSPTLTLTLTEENYLKAALQISINEQTDWVSTGRLAAKLGVSPGTVTSMLQSLAKEKQIADGTRPPLVTYRPRGGACLTDEGKKIALRILRRHRLIELFLVQTLKLTWDRVHEEAENMEHAVSDYLIDRIDEFLGLPTTDPHGDPIPTVDGDMRADRASAIPLAQCSPGTRVRLVHVVNQRADFLRYLSESGMQLGTVGVVEENNRAAGVITMAVSGHSVSMSQAVAESLLVEETLDAG